MVTRTHDKVVCLVATPVHLFGLAEGLIPSATGGWTNSSASFRNEWDKTRNVSDGDVWFS